MFATAIGGRTDGKEQAQTDAQICSEAPGSCEWNAGWLRWDRSRGIALRVGCGLVRDAGPQQEVSVFARRKRGSSGGIYGS